MNEKFNVCELMRSKDMREYYRNVKLNTDQKLDIIKSCYHSLTKQLECIKIILNDCNDKERKTIENNIKLYEWIIKLFYNPNEIFPNCKYFYIANEVCYFYNKFNNLSICDKLDTYSGSYDIYESINDIIQEFKGNEYCHINVELFLIIDNEISELISFSCSNINGEFVPFRSYILYDNVKDKYSEFIDIIRDYNHILTYFNTPFNNGDKLKIQLPILEKPIYGILNKEADQNGTWYHFLHDIKDNSISIDLSRVNINDTFAYSKFDWIERAQTDK